MSSYFDKREKFQNQVDILLPQFLKTLCNLCPSQEDSHGMNCAECCALNITFEKIQKRKLDDAPDCVLFGKEPEL